MHVKNKVSVLIFFVFMTNLSKNPSNYKNLIKSNRLLTLGKKAFNRGMYDLITQYGSNVMQFFLCQNDFLKIYKF